MNNGRDLTFGVNFRKRKARSGDRRGVPLGAIPRIARLMALAIRFEELVRKGEVRNYAELARLGRVTRTRMMQIMQLVHLAPDIQEQLLFMNSPGLTERKLREAVRHVDWDRQREIFRRLIIGLMGESKTQQIVQRNKSGDQAQIDTVLSPLTSGGRISPECRHVETT